MSPHQELLSKFIYLNEKTCCITDSPDCEFKDLCEPVVQHVCLEEVSRSLFGCFSDALTVYYFLISGSLLFCFLITLDSQWAAISSNGAFWNFSITWRLFALSCSSKPVVSENKPQTQSCFNNRDLTMRWFVSALSSPRDELLVLLRCCLKNIL